jgi:hypothetical protein
MDHSARDPSNIIFMHVGAALPLSVLRAHALAEIVHALGPLLVVPRMLASTMITETFPSEWSEWVWELLFVSRFGTHWHAVAVGLGLVPRELFDPTKTPRPSTWSSKSTWRQIRKALGDAALWAALAHGGVWDNTKKNAKLKSHMCQRWHARPWRVHGEISRHDAVLITGRLRRGGRGCRRAACPAQLSPVLPEHVR